MFQFTETEYNLPVPALFFKEIASPFSAADSDALRQMRVSAGMDLEQLNKWQEDITWNRRKLFLIYLSDPNTVTMQPHIYPNGQTVLVPTYVNVPPVGMIGIRFESSSDPMLASFSARGRVEITSLFVFAAYRHLRVGALAVMEMERRAANAGASYVTIHTPAHNNSLRVYGQMGYREFRSRSFGYNRPDSMIWSETTHSAYLEKQLR